MQYILTEDEYEELKSQQKEFNLAKTKRLQKLCTKICDTMPVQPRWKKDPFTGKLEPPEPWGCILSVKDDNEWFCDECPVQEICPGDKNYSK